MAKKKGMNTKQTVGVGVGLTAAAAAAAGAYFLYGSKNAPKNRKMVKSWMLKAKAEVLEQLEKAQHMTEGEYNALIDSVAAAYGALRQVTKNDVASFRREMKSHWKSIAKNAPGKKAKSPVRKTKKAPKKTSKKGVKKGTKKSAKRRR